jgi:hypothetical protein
LLEDKWWKIPIQSQSLRSQWDIIMLSYLAHHIQSLAGWQGLSFPAWDLAGSWLGFGQVDSTAGTFGTSLLQLAPS